MGDQFGRLYFFGMFGTATTGAVITRPGRVRAFVATNRSATARYFQLFASTGATTTIFMQFLVPAGDSIGLHSAFFGEQGIVSANGITYGFSTTAGSYVAATASECDLNLVYQY